MIVLDVKPYCHECDGFVPEVSTMYQTLSDTPIMKNVHCENRRKCDAIARYLERKKVGENDGTES